MYSTKAQVTKTILLNIPNAKNSLSCRKQHIDKFDTLGYNTDMIRQ